MSETTLRPYVPLARTWWRRRLVLAAAACCTLMAVIVGALLIDEDAADNLVAVVRPSLGGFGHVTWAWVPLLVAVAALHYGFAGVALRAASGLRMPLPEVVLAQLAAAAANRLMPLGLGAAAVNTRYLTRRGLPRAGALGSIGALQILGPLTDVAVVGAVLLAVPGSAGKSGQLTSGIGDSAQQLGSQIQRYAVPELSVVIAVLALLWMRSREEALLSRRRRPAHGAVSRGFGHVTLLLNRPRDLALAAASSAGTTLVLGVGFVISALAAGAVSSTGDAMAIFSTYLVASAVASAIPLPAAAGSTEAVLLGVLLASGVPTAHALPAVLLFRAVTFWAPAPVGLVAAGMLRRRRIL
ncbi:MAG TPA: lysylphosphatidylglycerol synthase transmembrane domain-containing protein [Mycobacteriales bacterium]|nr:lysylphosphatidylglycerol synthase transmembrane domain-containing protein [Mycobacteriales bacterium]